MGSQVYSLACLPLPPDLHGAVLLSTFTPHQGLYLWPLALNQQRTPNAVDIVPAFVEFNPRKEDRLWRILKRWEYQTTLPVSGETCMQAKKPQLELNMEQQTGSKLGKSTSGLEYSHPAYLTYMQSISWEIPGCEFQVGTKITGRNINTLRYADDRHHPNGLPWWLRW